MDENESIDISEFFYIIAKKKMIIITITLLTTIAAGIASYFIISPTYEALASVIVSKNETAAASANSTVQYDEVMMYENIVKTYANIGSSDVVYDKASQKLNNSISSDNLAKVVKITPVDNTQILTITADGKNPQQVLNIVQATSEAFISVSKDVYPAADIKIVNKAKLPKAPIKPEKLKNIAIGFFVGLIFSVGLVILLDRFDNTLESVEDIKRYTELPVLGMIQFDERK